MSDDEELQLRLTKSAARLNKASDELSKAVEVIEGSLKNLNLGLSTWVPFDDESTRCELGYAKIGNRWCLAIAERDTNEEGFEWAFSDAPRDLRLVAVPHIPALLATLAKEADAFAAELEAQTKVVRSIPV